MKDMKDVNKRKYKKDNMKDGQEIYERLRKQQKLNDKLVFIWKCMLKLDVVDRNDRRRNCWFNDL